MIDYVGKARVEVAMSVGLLISQGLRPVQVPAQLQLANFTQVKFPRQSP